MNAPFQSVGIIFLVTIVHVVAIAVYSSRALPETTFQRSIVVPDVESLEIMPEQLVRELSASDVEIEPESCLECLEMGIVAEGDFVAETTILSEKTGDVVTVEVPKRKMEVPQTEKVAVKEAPPQQTVTKEVVAAAVFKEIPAERWEDSDFSKRISYPTLDGILDKKSRKLAENKQSPVSKKEIERSTGEPTPRARSFSPIPRS